MTSDRQWACQDCARTLFSLPLFPEARMLRTQCSGTQTELRMTLAIRRKRREFNVAVGINNRGQVTINSAMLD